MYLQLRNSYVSQRTGLQTIEVDIETKYIFLYCEKVSLRLLAKYKVSVFQRDLCRFFSHCTVHVFQVHAYI